MKYLLFAIFTFWSCQELSAQNTKNKLILTEREAIQDSLYFNNQMKVIEKRFNKGQYEDAADRAKILVVKYQTLKSGQEPLYSYLLKSLCMLGDTAELNKYKHKALENNVAIDAVANNCQEAYNNRLIDKNVNVRNFSSIEIGTGKQYGIDSISQFDLPNFTGHIYFKNNFYISPVSSVVLTYGLSYNTFTYPEFNFWTRNLVYDKKQLVTKDYRSTTLHIGVGYEYLVWKRANLRITPNILFELPVMQRQYDDSLDRWKKVYSFYKNPIYIVASLDVEKRFRLGETKWGIGVSVNTSTYVLKPRYYGGYLRFYF